MREQDGKLIFIPYMETHTMFYRALSTALEGAASPALQTQSCFLI